MVLKGILNPIMINQFVFFKIGEAILEFRSLEFLSTLKDEIVDIKIISSKINSVYRAKLKIMFRDISDVEGIMTSVTSMFVELEDGRQVNIKSLIQNSIGENIEFTIKQLGQN